MYSLINLSKEAGKLNSSFLTTGTGGLQLKIFTKQRLSTILLFTTLLSCKHVSDRGSETLSTGSSSATEDRSEALHKAVLKAVTENQENGNLKVPAWFESKVALDTNWIVQSPDGYWGKSASSLPKDLGCAIGDENCDPQFLRRLCSTDSDCKQFNAACKPLESSIYESGQKAKTMCLGSGDSLLDRFYNVIVSGEREVDITTLSLPMNRFYEMTVNALTRLALSQNVPSVRILLSGVKTHSLNILNLPSGLLPKLVVDMKARVAKDQAGNLRTDTAQVIQDQKAIDNLQIEMKYLSKPLSLSWNHAKIIIADQKLAIQGGHNFYDPDYLEDRPVFDLSMEFSGEAVPKVTNFVNQLWEFADLYAAKNVPSKNIGSRKIMGPTVSNLPSYPAIGVGRFGGYGDNPSDRAFKALLFNAKHTIDIAQEDIYSRIPVLASLGAYKITESVALPELVSAVLDHQVRLRIVQSDQESFEGYGMMGLAEGHARLVKALLEGAKKRNVVAPPGESLRYYVCTLFEHAPWRFNKGQDRWAGDRSLDVSKIGSHPKLIIVDGSSFYLGSHNFYPASLQEFGFVISSVKATADIQKNYWDKVWWASSPDKADCGDKSDESVTYVDKQGKKQTI